MKKKTLKLNRRLGMKTTILLFFVTTNLMLAQHPTLDYIHTLETDILNPIHVSAIASEVDKSGNLYVLGKLRGELDIDPSINETILTATGGSANGGDFFLAKYNKVGSLLWGFNIGGAGTVTPRGLSLDSSNNPIVSGQFRGAVDFDPGSGEEMEYSSIYGDGFIVKYSSNGFFMWKNTVRNFGIDLRITDHITEIDNTTGNSVISGVFNDAIEILDVNGQVIFLTTSSLGLFDGFIAELDANGNWIRMEQIVYTGLNVAVKTIDYDSQFNVILGLTLDDVTTFDFAEIKKYPASWNETTLITIKPASNAFTIFELNEVAIDQSDTNRMYLTGYFKGNLSLNGIPILSNTSSDNDGFLIKANKLGNLGWVKHIKNVLIGYDNITPTAMVANDQRIFLSAAFFGSYDILNRNGQHQFIHNYSSGSACVIKYRSDGTIIWDANLKSTSVGNSVASISLDNGNFYLYGIFGGVTDFDMDPFQQSNTNIANGTKDFFIGKYIDYQGFSSTSSTSKFETLTDMQNENDLRVFSLYEKTYSINYTSQLDHGVMIYRVLNSFGQEIQSGVMQKGMAGYHADTNLSALSSGVYLIEIYNNNFKMNKRIIVK